MARRPWWKWVVVGVVDAAGAVAWAATVFGGVSGAVGASAGASTLVDWVSLMSINNTEKLWYIKF